MNILCLLFLRDIHEGNFSLKDAEDEQIKFANTLKNLDKSKKKKQLKKISF